MCSAHAYRFLRFFDLMTGAFRLSVHENSVLLEFVAFDGRQLSLSIATTVLFTRSAWRFIAAMTRSAVSLSWASQRDQ